MMSGLFGLEASHAVFQRTLDQAVAAHSEVVVGFHVHVAEDRGDLQATRREYGSTPVAPLAAAGVLNKGSLAIHCVHLEDSDYRELKVRGVRAVFALSRTRHRVSPRKAPPIWPASGVPVSRPWSAGTE